MNLANTETIAAIATPSGNGGVAIIRVSGYLATKIAGQLFHKALIPRIAIFTPFYAENCSVIDSGIAIYFPGPASYTGEDVLELQAHGGLIVINMLLKRVLSLGARLARPGEFTERAFINNKIDLAQAEAIADLIESTTEQSVRSAQRSLQGVFSGLINSLLTELTELRVYIEAAIDFVDEEIDFLTDGVVENRLADLLRRLEHIQRTAHQGRLLRDGMTIVLAGKPNAGKSSLLNALAGHEAAIVTDIAGTTRDVLRERIQIDGMPLHIIDTAGLRDSDNAVEREGIRRAREEIKNADKVLLLVDSTDPHMDGVVEFIPEKINLTRVINKIDLAGKEPAVEHTESGTQIYLSVKTGAGMNLLVQHLKESVGFSDTGEDIFIARTRHLEALKKSREALQNALNQLTSNLASELVAEELRIAQQALAEITGEFSSDDLLGKIFSSFCIGK